MTLLEQLALSSNKTPRTKEFYFGRVRDFVAFAGTEPAAWTPLNVERWRDHHLERGLTPTTVASYIKGLRYVLRRYAQICDGKDFALHAEVPSQIGSKDALTRVECRQLIATCAAGTPRDLRDCAMILTGIHTAFRRQEIADLELQNIQDHDSTASLSVIVKGRKWHTVEIDAEPWAAIKDWIYWMSLQGVTKGHLFRQLRRAVALPGIGPRLSGDGIYKILLLRADQAGIEDFHPHRLRHTFVTLAREAGWQDWQIRKVTGHFGPQVVGAESKMVDHYTQPLGGLFPSLGSEYDEG